MNKGRIQIALIGAITFMTLNIVEARAQSSVSQSEQRASNAAVTDEQQLLRDLNDTLHKISAASADLFKEVSRTAPAPLTSQDMLDEYVMDPWVSAYPNLQAFDPALIQSLKKGPLLPPRKKWLDYETDKLEKLLYILSQELTQLAPPADATGPAADAFKAEQAVITDTAARIKSEFSALPRLTAGPTFDNKSIAESAQKIASEAKGMSDCTRRLAKLTKKIEN